MKLGTKIMPCSQPQYPAIFAISNNMADAATSQVRGRIYEFCLGKMETSTFITLKEKPAVAMDNSHFIWGKLCR
jgi:hypothetical protein